MLICMWWKQTSLASNFRLLARYTGLSPVANILIYAWPNISLSDKMLCSSNSRVGHGMQLVENEATITQSNI